MPVISRDYWVSLFFGNTLYMIAFGYYFVITFLGYNGKSDHAVLFPQGLSTDVCDSSITLSTSYGASPVTCSGTCHIVGSESLWAQSTATFCARSLGFGGFAEIGIAYRYIIQYFTLDPTFAPQP